MLRLGYKVLVENVQLLSTCQLVNLVRAPVSWSILRTGGCLARDLSVSECSRVVLMHSGSLAIIKYTVV